MQEYKTLYESCQAELIEKKSRFIAELCPIKTEEEANAFIAEIKKKHWNASHNCFAYVIGEHHEIQRCSDDGEPSGTAGRPMLDILLGEKLHDTLVVVTRYFGGTLLGTGGLVRAYSGAVKEGIKVGEVITKIWGNRLLLDCEYTETGKVQYILAQDKIDVIGTEYTDRVLIETILPEGKRADLEKKLMEGTNGKIKIIEKEICYYAKIAGELKIYSENTKEENIKEDKGKEA